MDMSTLADRPDQSEEEAKGKVIKKQQQQIYIVDERVPVFFSCHQTSFLRLVCVTNDNDRQLKGNEAPARPHIRTRYYFVAFDKRFGS